MTVRLTVCALAAAGAVLVTTACASPATASPRHENVLRAWCSRTVATECTVRANDDDGAVFVGRSGHRYQPRSESAALRYLGKHAVPCREEDSPACVWNAGVAGNGRGSSFFVVGGHREGEGVVFYTYLV